MEIYNEHNRSKSYDTILSYFHLILELYSLCDLVKSLRVHYLRIKTDIASKNNVNPNLISKIKKMFLKIESNLCDDKFDLVYLHRLCIDLDIKKIKKVDLINVL